MSVASLNGPLPAVCAEVAFVGRSNTGKSSAINALANRKRLAFVSKTPGRTQLINFFRLAADDRYLVDLPGYGYAAVPESVRRDWDTLVGGYLRARPGLKGVILIMDARRPLLSLDHQLIEWIAIRQIPIHVLLGKCDKLGRQEADRTLSEVRRKMDQVYPNYSAQLFSSLKRVGIAETAKKVTEWLQ